MALAQRTAITSRGARFAVARPAIARPRVVARAVSEVTDGSFAEDVLKSSTPVLVDFWAPCKLELRRLAEASSPTCHQRLSSSVQDIQPWPGRQAMQWLRCILQPEMGDLPNVLSAAGCGPCRMIAPIIDELANEYGSKLKCVKLNTDESPQVATDYGIRSIPTVSQGVHPQGCGAAAGLQRRSGSAGRMEER